LRPQAGNVKYCPKRQGRHNGKEENDMDVWSELSSECNTKRTVSTL